MEGLEGEGEEEGVSGREEREGERGGEALSLAASLANVAPLSPAAEKGRQVRVAVTCLVRAMAAKSKAGAERERERKKVCVCVFAKEEKIERVNAKGGPLFWCCCECGDVVRGREPLVVA